MERNIVLELREEASELRGKVNRLSEFLSNKELMDKLNIEKEMRVLMSNQLDYMIGYLKTLEDREDLLTKEGDDE